MTPGRASGCWSRSSLSSRWCQASPLIVTLVNTDPILLDDFVAIAAYMMSFLLPFLAIMLVTASGPSAPRW